MSKFKLTMVSVVFNRRRKVLFVMLPVIEDKYHMPVDQLRALFHAPDYATIIIGG